jgi:hypothetical protein
MMIYLSLKLYADLCLDANQETGVTRANKSDYHSKTAKLFDYASLSGFEGVWWSWRATTGMEFCTFFRIRSLRFAELVQAGVGL